MHRRSMLAALGAWLAAGRNDLVAQPAPSGPSAPAPGDGGHESRVIQNEGFNWFDRDAARRMIERISAAGFNVLITCVWHGSGASWPSKVAPMCDAYPGGDPFAELLDLAAKAGIEVHAWITVALRQREFLDSFRAEGTPADKFEIHLPGFRRFISDAVLEFVNRYPVQGLNLDYVRAGGVSLSSAAQADYSQQTGRSLLLDRTLQTPAARASIEQWQQSAVAEIIGRIATGARAARPGILLSVDAAPWYAPYRLQGQDSVRWANEGLIDVLYSMNYQDVLDLAALHEIKGSLKRPSALVPIVSDYVNRNGGGAASRPAEALNGLIDQARSISHDNGVAVYLYNMLDDLQIRQLRRTAFAAPAAPKWIR
jgi:uncharacterized lipoprotein YddW (UPF0748 family)